MGGRRIELPAGSVGTMPRWVRPLGWASLILVAYLFMAFAAMRLVGNCMGRDPRLTGSGRVDWSLPFPTPYCELEDGGWIRLSDIDDLPAANRSK